MKKKIIALTTLLMSAFVLLSLNSSAFWCPQESEMEFEITNKSGAKVWHYVWYENLEESCFEETGEIIPCGEIITTSSFSKVLDNGPDILGVEREDDYCWIYKKDTKPVVSQVGPKEAFTCDELTFYTFDETLLYKGPNHNYETLEGTIPAGAEFKSKLFNFEDYRFSGFTYVKYEELEGWAALDAYMSQPATVSVKYGTFSNTGNKVLMVADTKCYSSVRLNEGTCLYDLEDECGILKAGYEPEILFSLSGDGGDIYCCEKEGKRVYFLSPFSIDIKSNPGGCALPMKSSFYNFYEDHIIYKTLEDVFKGNGSETGLNCNDVFSVDYSVNFGYDADDFRTAYRIDYDGNKYWVIDSPELDDCTVYYSTTVLNTLQDVDILYDYNYWYDDYPDCVESDIIPEGTELYAFFSNYNTENAWQEYYVVYNGKCGWVRVAEEAFEDYIEMVDCFDGIPYTPGCDIDALLKESEKIFDGWEEQKEVMEELGIDAGNGAGDGPALTEGNGDALAPRETVSDNEQEESPVVLIAVGCVAAALVVLLIIRSKKKTK